MGKLILLPTWKSRRVEIPHVRLSDEQVLQRRIFHQKRIINMLPSVDASIITVMRENDKLKRLLNEIL